MSGQGFLFTLSWNLLAVSCAEVQPLKLSGTYMYRLRQHSVTVHFAHVFCGFCMVLKINSDDLLKQPLTG
jgi:hypothetical protein